MFDVKGVLNSTIRKVKEFIDMIKWIFKVASKPGKDEYMTVLRLGLLVTLAIGVYSFLFSLAGEALLGVRRLALPYPLNVIVGVVITGIIVGFGLYVWRSLKKMR